MKQGGGRRRWEWATGLHFFAEYTHALDHVRVFFYAHWHLPTILKHAIASSVLLTIMIWAGFLRLGDYTGNNSATNYGEDIIGGTVRC